MTQNGKHIRNKCQKVTNYDKHDKQITRCYSLQITPNNIQHTRYFRKMQGMTKMTNTFQGKQKQFPGMSWE